MLPEMTWTRKTAVGVLVTGAVLLLTLIVQTALGSGHPWGETALYGGALAYFLVLGTVLIWRLPGNRIGWIFALMGVALGVAGVSGSVGSQAGALFDAIGSAAWMGWIGALLLLLILYPTGHFLGGLWRWAGWLTLALVTFGVLGTLFAEELCIEGGLEACDVWADNPIGIAGVPHPEFWEPFGSLILIMLGLSIAALVARYRRADRVQRLQLKWFLYAGSGFVASILVEVVYSVGGSEPPLWVLIVYGLAMLGIPIAATMAILRYRLYEIDRIIARTVSYVVVVGALGLVVLAPIAILAAFLPSDNPLVVAVSTLAAAALFNPLRRRVQSAVDHRFNRSRYDAQRVAESFTETLQEQVDPDDVVEGWLEVVEVTMQPSAVGYWIRKNEPHRRPPGLP